MSAAELKEMREEMKNFIEHADEMLLLKMHAMIEAGPNADWWDTMPDNIKADVTESIAQADRGEVITHQEMKKKHPQWFTK